MMTTITKRHLYETIAEQTGLSQREARQVVYGLFKQLTEELIAGNRIEIRGFGSFDVRRTAPRPARNPRTLELVQIPSRLRVRFKPGRILNAALKGVSCDDQLSAGQPARAGASNQ